MNLSITKQFKFCSAHQLWDSKLTRAQNEAVFGKCSRMHGHNYVMDVTVRGPKWTVDHRSRSGMPPSEFLRDGMLINFDEIKSLVNEKVVDLWDHYTLNDLPQFDGLLPTAENMVLRVVDALSPYLCGPGVFLESVTIWETDTCKATITLE